MSLKGWRKRDDVAGVTEDRLLRSSVADPYVFDASWIWIRIWIQSSQRY
jgi:hypothetical protein